MLGDVLELVQTLIELISRFQSAKQEKRQRIKNYFDYIADSLRIIADEVERSNTPSERLSELEQHARELSETIGDEIGIKRANELSSKLISIVNAIALNSSSVGDIRKASGMFKAFAIQSTTQPTRIILPSMSRRQLLVGLAIISAASAIVYPIASTFAIGKTKWKMVNYFGTDAKDTIIATAAQRVRNRVEEMSGGTFLIEITQGGNITGDQILEKVHQGNDFQCGYSGMYYANEQFRPLYFGCAIPFGLNPQEQNAWLNYKKTDAKADKDGYIPTFMQSIYSQINECSKVIPFPAGATGKQMGGWFNKPINSIDDFRGLTMRIPGLGADILRDFDVKSDKDIYGKHLKINEIADAMKGPNPKIQAAEWIGPHDDMQLGLHEVAKYYYYPGWWEPGTTFELQVNVDAWNKLSKEHKEILQAACTQTHLEVLNEYESKNAEALKQLRELKEGKPTFLTFNDNILAELKNKAEKLFREYDKNPLFKNVHNEYETFKSGIQNWSNLG